MQSTGHSQLWGQISPVLVVLGQWPTCAPPCSRTKVHLSLHNCLLKGSHQAQTKFLFLFVSPAKQQLSFQETLCHHLTLYSCCRITELHQYQEVSLEAWIMYFLRRVGFLSTESQQVYPGTGHTPPYRDQKGMREGRKLLRLREQISKNRWQCQWPWVPFFFSSHKI